MNFSLASWLVQENTPTTNWQLTPSENRSGYRHHGDPQVNLGQNKDESNILELISPDEFTILPNTAGCYTADESVRTCKLARELLGGHSLVKLEVIGDKNTLLPDMPETLKAAKDLVKEGFEVMVYCTDDFDYAVALEDAGCVAVMPLAAPIGSGRGIENPQAIEAIVKKFRFRSLLMPALELLQMQLWQWS